MFLILSHLLLSFILVLCFIYSFSFILFLSRLFYGSLSICLHYLLLFLAILSLLFSYVVSLVLPFFFLLSFLSFFLCNTDGSRPDRAGGLHVWGLLQDSGAAVSAVCRGVATLLGSNLFYWDLHVLIPYFCSFCVYFFFICAVYQMI